MNEMQKRHILTLRQQGIGYAEIARRLDIKRETVKTHCRRHGLLLEAIQQRPRGRIRKIYQCASFVFKGYGLPLLREPWDQLERVDLEDGADCQPKAHLDVPDRALPVFQALILPDMHAGDHRHLLLG